MAYSTHTKDNHTGPGKWACLKQPVTTIAAALLLALVPALSSVPVFAQTMITGAQIRNPLNPVSSLPSTCTPYTVYFLTTTNTAYICSAVNTLTPLGSGSSGSSGSGLPGQSGTAGYLYSDGSSISWSHLITGGSGALDCISTPGQCDVTSIVPLKGSANTWTGANDFENALLRLPETTVAGLPVASGNTGREFVVTDSTAPCSIATGGGTSVVLVRSNGFSYDMPNCSSSSGGSGGSGSSGGTTMSAQTLIPLSNVNAWGDSLTQGTGSTGTPLFATGTPSTYISSGSYTGQLQTMSGVNISPHGYYGATSTTITGECTADTTRAGWLNIIWMGTNDPGSSISAATTLSNFSACIATLTGPFIVVDPINYYADNTTWIGASNYSFFTSVKAGLLSAYPNNFIDFWSYLVAQGCNTSGLYYNSTDCFNGVVPRGLTSIGVHLNNAGYGMLSQLIYNWMQAHGGTSTPNINSLNQSLYQTGALGNVCVGGGTAQAQSVMCTPSLPPFRDGSQFCYTPSVANTGAAPTLYIDGNINGTTPYPIVKTGGAALVLNDIVPTAKACLVFDVTGGSYGQFELQNAQTGSAGSGSGSSGSGQSTTLSQIVYPLFGYGYPSTMAISPAGPKSAQALVFTTQSTMAVTGLSFSLTTGTGSTCNGGSGPCGVSAEILSLDPSNANPPAGATVQCATEDGYPGAPAGKKGIRDTSAPAVIGLAFVSGSSVASGTCTLAAGGHVLILSAEGAGAVQSLYNIVPLFAVQAKISPFFYGYTATLATTGTGSTYALPALTSTTFNSGYGAYSDAPYVVIF